MFDEKKRDTLKILGAATGVAAMPTVLSAGQSNTKFFDESSALANIDIKVRVSVTSNDLELMISNTGSEATSLTQVTPATLETGRGYFDLQSLTANGALKLEPGQSVTLDMQKPADISALSGVSNSLVEDLRQRVSIVTENDAFAAVSISRMPYFV